MTIYNPVRPLTPMDKIRDIYWSSRAVRFAVDFGFLAIGLATVAGLVLVAAA